MIERNRRGLTAEQKAELWKRWKAGQSLHAIGRALSKDHVVVHFVLAKTGFIRNWPAPYQVGILIFREGLDSSGFPRALAFP